MTNRMKITDDETGIAIDMTVSPDLPEGTAARRFGAVLELIEYHRFQSGDMLAEEEGEGEGEGEGEERPRRRSPQNVSEIVKALKRQGLTQRDIAAEIGVSEPAVSQWARGECRPSPSSKRALDGLLDGVQSDERRNTRQ